MSKKLLISENLVAPIIQILGKLPTEQTGQLYFQLMSEVQPQIEQLEKTPKADINEKKHQRQT